MTSTFAAGAGLSAVVAACLSGSDGVCLEALRGGTTDRGTLCVMALRVQLCSASLHYFFESTSPENQNLAWFSFLLV